jgi:acetyl esterase/lipase
LLKTVPAQNIAVFGTSTGGGLTMALVLRAKQDGFALPAAIAPGSPWADLTKTGDTFYIAITSSITFKCRMTAI